MPSGRVSCIRIRDLLDVVIGRVISVSCSAVRPVPLDEVMLPCLLNLMWFVVSGSRRHSWSLLKYVFLRKPFIATYLLA